MTFLTLKTFPVQADLTPSIFTKAAFLSPDSINTFSPAVPVKALRPAKAESGDKIRKPRRNSNLKKLAFWSIFIILANKYPN